MASFVEEWLVHVDSICRYGDAAARGQGGAVCVCGFGRGVRDGQRVGVRRDRDISAVGGGGGIGGAGRPPERTGGGGGWHGWRVGSAQAHADPPRRRSPPAG